MKNIALFLCTMILFSFVGCQNTEVDEMPYRVTDMDELFHDLQMAQQGSNDSDKRLKDFDDILVPVLRINGYKILVMEIYSSGRYVYEYIPENTPEGKETSVDSHDRLIVNVYKEGTADGDLEGDVPVYNSKADGWKINFGTRSVGIYLPLALVDGKIKENMDIKEYIEIEIYQITDAGVVKTGNLV